MSNYTMAFSFGIGVILAGVIFLILIFVNEKKHRELIIIKEDPCQFETIQEGIEAVDSRPDCDPVIVRDPTGYQIPDDVNELEIHYNTINGKQSKPKYYKRNSDGIFKQVYR